MINQGNCGTIIAVATNSKVLYIYIMLYVVTINDYTYGLYARR